MIPVPNITRLDGSGTLDLEKAKTTVDETLSSMRSPPPANGTCHPLAKSDTVPVVAGISLDKLNEANAGEVTSKMSCFVVTSYKPTVEIVGFAKTSSESRMGTVPNAGDEMVGGSTAMT
jgi:hypothetical protein